MPGDGQPDVQVGLRMAPDPTLAHGRYVVAGFRDTGTGIPGDVMSRVFDPFFTTREIGKGTGPGLSQVCGIARQAGDTARIESEEGRGTTVQLWLPVCEQVVSESEAVWAVVQKVEG